MTKKELEFITRISPKGQIVLRKEARRLLGIKPGSLVEQKIRDRKLIIEPFDWNREMIEFKKLSKLVSKKWPKEISAVKAIREDRE